MFNTGLVMFVVICLLSFFIFYFAVAFLCVYLPVLSSLSFFCILSDSVVGCGLSIVIEVLRFERML